MRFLRLLTRSLILLLIALFSALAAMRFAIHGREVRVPDLRGMTTLQAQETANEHGLIVSAEDKFYSSATPAGHVISQAPFPGSRVRRGWRVRVAESLGSQRVTIPNLMGQTELAATLNLRQRGLDLATVAGVAISNTKPDEVVAQFPSPDATDVTSPAVSLLLSQRSPPPAYVMPNFVGRQLADAKEKISRAGLQLASVEVQQVNSTPSGSEAQSTPAPPMPTKVPTSGKIARQSPPPGSRVTPETPIRVEIEP
ncbi:MAG: PASTA domain-containing protein [Terriglobales bacterium]